MSRPQKLHKPIKGAFNNILAAIGAGTGSGKRAANKAAASPPLTKPVAKKEK